MKKLVIAAVLAATAAPAMAQYNMTYYLVSQWTEGANRFCKYSNGAVIPVGISLCPLSIKGY
jgi:hypothetical protein